MRAAILTLLLATVATACAPTPAPRDEASPTEPSPPAAWPEPPAVPAGALEPAVEDAIDRLVTTSLGRGPDPGALDEIAASGDARLAWLLADVMRFAPLGAGEDAVIDAFARLTGADARDTRFGANPWLAVTNLLIGWDLPAPPGYRERKAALFLGIEPKWAPFFADEASTIDWRVTTWGGVFIDDRAIGDGQPCSRGCIPALDDPALTPAADGDWYGDDRIVFGVTVGDESVAFPKHIMEVHEMVNITIGGRRIGLPYCTLCGSAQAYLTDATPEGVETIVLRTSGLLTRSNKVMYDLASGSAFDTFRGDAVSGPLREIGFVLEETSVTVSSWGEWKAAHPNTKIVARDGGIGRTYPDDPLCGRDDGGPIFPIGPADSRLPAQAPVVGVIDGAGMPVAFAADLARAELAAGRAVALGDVELTADGGGLHAVSVDGNDLVAHEAFWFAWSQFHPETALWAPPGIEAPPAPPPVAPTLDTCSELFDPFGSAGPVW